MSLNFWANWSNLELKIVFGSQNIYFVISVRHVIWAQNHMEKTDCQAQLFAFFGAEFS